MANQQRKKLATVSKTKIKKLIYYLNKSVAFKPKIGESKFNPPIVYYKHYKLLV